MSSGFLSGALVPLWLMTDAVRVVFRLLPFPAWVAWCTPLLGVVLMAAAWWLFLRESRQYQSSRS